MKRFTVRDGNCVSLTGDGQVLSDAIRILNAYEETGLAPEEILPLATMMKAFGHGEPNKTVFVGNAETNQVVIRGKVYSILELRNAVEELAKAREGIKGALAVWEKAQQYIADEFFLVGLPVTVGWDDRLRELLGEGTR